MRHHHDHHDHHSLHGQYEQYGAGPRSAGPEARFHRPGPGEFPGDPRGGPRGSRAGGPRGGGPRGGGPRGGSSRGGGFRDPGGDSRFEAPFGPEGEGPRGPGAPFGRGRGGGSRGRGRGPGRATRGDVRTAVLLLLSDEPMHGYQLMQTISDRTGGRWSPSPGAIYPTLSQLEDEGLVEMSKEGGRKLATLTDAGRAHVEENSSSWTDPFPSAPGESPETAPDLREQVHALQSAVREVMRVGSDQQVAEVARILTDARRSLYRLLAEDDGADSSSTDTDRTPGS